jgi:hypothetical protein
VKELIVALFVLNGADNVTTCMHLSRGAGEGNFLLPSSCPANVAVTTAETAVIAWASTRLEKKHRLLARGLLVSVAGGKGFAVGWNVAGLLERRK